MRPAVAWGLGVLAVVGILGGTFAVLTASEPETSQAVTKPTLDKTIGARARSVGPLDPDDLARVNRLRELAEAGKLQRLRARTSRLTVEAVDAALAGRRKGIEACLDAARVHGSVPESLTLTLALEQDDEATKRGELAVDEVTTGLDDAQVLDQCLTNALRPLRFVGDEALDIRATWPPR